MSLTDPGRGVPTSSSRATQSAARALQVDTEGGRHAPAGEGKLPPDNVVELWDNQRAYVGQEWYRAEVDHPGANFHPPRTFGSMGVTLCRKRVNPAGGRVGKAIVG
jgi:hypothetical protein